jgi:serine/threonine-protein kinase
MYCWGNNADNQFGPSVSSGVKTSPISTALYISKISVGDMSSNRRVCGIDDNSHGVCYGSFPFGNLSSSGYAAQMGPANPLVGPESTYSAGDFSCFLKQGRVYCLGGNGQGQLGDGLASGASSSYLVTPTGLTTGVTSLDIHGKSACAIINRSSLYCWGAINGASVPTEVVVDVQDIISLETVAVGSNFLCVVNSGKPYCRGDNSFGQLGSGSASPSSTTFQEVLKTDNSSFDSVQLLDAGDSHACLSSFNNVYCWGRNNKGQVGNNSTNNSNKASLVGF